MSQNKLTNDTQNILIASFCKQCRPALSNSFAIRVVCANCGDEINNNIYHRGRDIFCCEICANDFNS